MAGSQQGIVSAQRTSRDAWRNPYAIGWLLALLFYVLEYAARAAPAVMIPQLAQGFGRGPVGVSSILGSYYYAYSLTSLLAGVALDRFGAKYVVSIGAFVLAFGCLLFRVEQAEVAYLARLLQGAGSAFAFTGAVYLAARAFSPGTLATAIGVTQCLGMIGGSAGQVLVGPILAGGGDWRVVWSCLGVMSLLVASSLFLVTPRAGTAGNTLRGGLLAPYRIVLANPQSYLCGLIAGLLFAPTTIGAMTWGVAFFQSDRGVPYADAVAIAAMIPLGWAVGCPLLGWAADRIGRRKPVLAGGAAALLLFIAQVTFAPSLLSPYVGLFLVGVASGAAMIPYTIIKEANPDNAKGSATGAINFLNFGVTALLGPAFTTLFGKTLATTGDPVRHFQHAGTFWFVAVILALILTALLRETGSRRA